MVGRLSARALLLLLALATPTVAAETAVEADSPTTVEAERAAGVAVERAPAPPELVQAQLDAAEWIDRLSGVYALQRMGAAAAPAAPALVAALADENGLVRFEAAESLTRIGAPAVPLLVAQLASERAAVRLLAVQALGRIGLSARPALPALRAAVADADPDVRDAATFAVSVVQPEGVLGWLRKIGFEIGDEPWGIPGVLIAFVVLAALASLRPALRAIRHARGADAVAAEHAAAAVGEQADQPPEEDDEEDDDEDEGQGEADQARRAARSAAAGAAHDRLAPSQGLPHAMAGLVAMSVAGLVFVLATLAERTTEERHGMYHFAALFGLFGYLFVKVGLKGAWTERRARLRLASAGERWLRDRAWSRDGSGPIRAERVLPNVIALLLWVAFLMPFHTVWRLPFSYWGVWIVLAIFDLIAVAILVAVARRIWRRLRAGRSFLRWQGVPVRPGGTFSARFETARSLAGGAPLEARLRCLRDRPDNRVIGDEPAADAEEIYAEEKSFPLRARPEGGSWAQLSFSVPPDARGTDSYAARPVRWVVTVGLPTAGPDFRTTFPVPIYR